jgi:hypothetical protein
VCVGFSQFLQNPLPLAGHTQAAFLVQCLHDPRIFYVLPRILRLPVCMGTQCRAAPTSATPVVLMFSTAGHSITNHPPGHLLFQRSSIGTKVHSSGPQ